VKKKTVHAEKMDSAKCLISLCGARVGSIHMHHHLWAPLLRRGSVSLLRVHDSMVRWPLL
jgi:hypothetical protein